MRVMGALQLEAIPMMEKTTPGISKYFDSGLVTREEGEEGQSAHLKTWRPLPCFPETVKKKLLSFSH